MVEYLILNGADTEIKANDGVTAYGLALMEELKETAAVIRRRTRDYKQAMAKSDPEERKAALRQLHYMSNKKKSMVLRRKASAQAIRKGEVTTTKRTMANGAAAARAAAKALLPAPIAYSHPPSRRSLALEKEGAPKGDGRCVRSAAPPPSSLVPLSNSRPLCVWCVVHVLQCRLFRGASLASWDVGAKV
jgi:hypothetical protein